MAWSMILQLLFGEQLDQITLGLDEAGDVRILRAGRRRSVLLGAEAGLRICPNWFGYRPNREADAILSRRNLFDHVGASVPNRDSSRVEAVGAIGGKNHRLDGNVPDSSQCAAIHAKVC